MSSLVVGGRDEAQFADTLQACDLKLTEDDIKRLGEISRPPLIYPYWHQGQFTHERFTDADRALHEGNPPP